MKKRMPSTKTNLKEIVTGHCFKGEGDFAPNYMITKNYKKMYRAKVVASVLKEPFISDDESYGRMLIDDTTETIQAYFFRENTVLLKNISQGDMLQIVGKVSEWKNRNQLNAEAAAVVSPNFWILHRLELLKENKNIEVELKKAQKIKSEEKNLKNAKERAEAEEIDIEIIDALYKMEYTEKEEEIDTTTIKDEILTVIERLDEGKGVELDVLVSEITEFPDEEIESVVRELLIEGDIFEPTINRYTIV
ncbi:MAG: OB-fold nucleic acid binding domain-containing protein [Euryarchaeota archaeon]|nr:OB-fold nucleic acid binding domain-containing protein [Euryarchaeota archaeon]